MKIPHWVGRTSPLDQIYYPRVDEAYTHDMGLMVTNGSDFFSDWKNPAHQTHKQHDFDPSYRRQSHSYSMTLPNHSHWGYNKAINCIIGSVVVDKIYYQRRQVNACRKAPLLRLNPNRSNHRYRSYDSLARISPTQNDN